MFESAPAQTQLSLGRGEENTRTLDTAVGILVGWQRCSTDAAFRGLVFASERHGVPILALAGALVNLATRDADSRITGSPAQLAVEREWGLNYLM